MNEYCAEKGFAGWFETSAKENIGIDEAASFLVNKVRNINYHTIALSTYTIPYNDTPQIQQTSL